jgi:hypothetical protein
VTPDWPAKTSPALLDRLLAAFGVTDPLDRPRRRRRVERVDGAKRITNGTGRVRYRKRVRINGRKVAVVTS